MHMADALVSPAVAGTMYAASTLAAAYSVKKVREEDNPKMVPVMGVMGAFVFAAQMINFTIPGTGSSGHLCGGMLVTALLGPYAGFLTMIGVLLIQCLMFADGGLLALGCNVWNMAFYGCFLGSIIWKACTKKGMDRKKIALASILGCILSLQCGAFSVTLETLLSGITELPFKTFLMAMQPIHLAIGLVEGLIITAVLEFVYEARPELLYGNDGTSKQGKFSFKTTLAAIAGFAAAVGGVLSLFASSNPDGLEWAIERLTGSTELEAASGIYDAAGSIQEATALLPDYALKGSESAIGTTISGLVGAAMVLVLCIVAARLFKLFRSKKVS